MDKILLDELDSLTEEIHKFEKLKLDNDKKENERSTGKFPLDTLYNPYPDSIYIYNNNYANTYWFPNLGNEIGKLIAWKFPFNTPFILWDGFVKSPAKDINLCLNQPNITFANINGPENLKNIKTGISNYLCKGQQLVPVVLLFKNEIITSIK